MLVNLYLGCIFSLSRNAEMEGFFFLSVLMKLLHVQPLADAIHYKNNEVIKVLDKYGAKIQVHSLYCVFVCI